MAAGTVGLSQQAGIAASYPRSLQGSLQGARKRYR
jgi:hypothetical protein